MDLKKFNEITTYISFFVILLISFFLISYIPIKVENSIRTNFCNHLVKKGYFKIEKNDYNDSYDICIDEYVSFMKEIKK